MILFKNVHLNKKEGVLEAQLEYTEDLTDIQGLVKFRIKDESLLGLNHVQGFHRNMILKAMISTYSAYRRGMIKDGERWEVAWG